MKFHEILKKIREERNLSTDSVAENIGVSVAAYRYYERGERQPTFETLCNIADYFDVSADFLLGRTDIKEPAFNDALTAMNVDMSVRRSANDFETAYKALDDRYKAVICQAITTIANIAAPSEKSKQKGADMKNTDIPLHKFRTFRRGVAAASWSAGAPTDETECEEVLYDTTGLKQRRDFDKCFVVPVEGDSMSPEYDDGDCVLVHPGLEVGEGDIGIFGMDGEVFIKKLAHNALHSLNDASPEYEDIFGEWETIGKVLGKVIPVAKK